MLAVNSVIEILSNILGFFYVSIKVFGYYTNKCFFFLMQKIVHHIGSFNQKWTLELRFQN